MRELQAIQADINMMDQAIQGGGSISNIESWAGEKEKYEREYLDANAYWEAQKTLEERVEEEVRDNGYVLDTLEVDGLTAPEIITDDNQYKLIRKGVQILVVGMNTSHLNIINALKTDQLKELQALTERATEAESKNEKLQTDNKELEVRNYELGLENDELSEKVRKVAQIQHESDQQIEQQKQHIADLQNQIAIGVRGALNVVNMPQDTSKLAAEIIASKPRITNVEFKDKNGIDTRTKTAEHVLTGQRFEYEAIYEKRYIILNEEQAEQYRADEADKKAEADQLAASIPVTHEEGVKPVDEVVLEEEATTKEETFRQEDQVDANTNGENTANTGNGNTDEVVEQTESEVVTRAEFETLKGQVKSIWINLGMPGAA